MNRNAQPLHGLPFPGDIPDWQRAVPRNLDPGTRRELEDSLRFVLETLGMPPETPGTRRTPRRLLDALIDMTAGYEGDAKAMTLFPAETDDDADDGEAEAAALPDAPPEQVIEGPIEFTALCEHHALPFIGTAFVGYVPERQIVGISKLTRLVRLFGRRFTIQERMGREIAAAMEAAAAPAGVAVALRARHLCSRARGVSEAAALTRTFTWRGAYRRDSTLQMQFLDAIGRSPGDSGGS